MKEIHIWMCGGYPMDDTDCDFYLTMLSVKNSNPIIHTTQPHFCHTRMFELGYKIFVHMLDGKTVEIRLGMNSHTNREIGMGHNLEHLLLGNEFGFAVE